MTDKDKWFNNQIHQEEIEIINLIRKEENKVGNLLKTEKTRPVDTERMIGQPKDAINPSHYKREGSMECIDEMRMLYGDDAVYWFCLLNSHKYRYRAADKNGLEDLKKSDWYLNYIKKNFSDKRITISSTFSSNIIKIGNDNNIKPL